MKHYLMYFFAMYIHTGKAETFNYCKENSKADLFSICMKLRLLDGWIAMHILMSGFIGNHKCFDFSCFLLLTSVRFPNQSISTNCDQLISKHLSFTFKKLNPERWKIC